MRSALKSLVLRGARLSPLRLIPLDAALRLSHRLGSALARLIFLRDWKLQALGRPQFFKHQIDLSLWPRDPSRWAFTARGVYAREDMFDGCKVLDLCCGDGSYSFLFFSDIAGKIDAVDVDDYALAYARRQFGASKITYHAIDVVHQPLPSNDYDFVIWNAAICYFHEADIRTVLEKIIAAGKSGMQVCGMLPKANGWVDHKTEFADRAAIEEFLRQYFGVVAIREVDEGSAISFYFKASTPFKRANAHTSEVHA